MKTSYQKVYEQLGNLFFAVAMADRVVRPAELARLKEQVKHAWVPLESSTDEFGTNAAHYISISFDYLADTDVSAGEAFDAFADYYKTHHMVFSHSLKERIRETSKKIAESFRNTNKAEQNYLVRLDQLLK